MAPAKTKKKSDPPAPDTAVSPPLPAVPLADLNAPLKVEEIEIQEVVPLEKKNKLQFFIGVITLFISLIIITAIYIALQKESAPGKTSAPSSPTSVPVPAVLPFNPKNWSLEILNGSGTAGTAKKAADMLTPLGYQIISIGNADKSDYKNVQVFISIELEIYHDEFINSLKTVYPEARFSRKL